MKNAKIIFGIILGIITLLILVFCVAVGLFYVFAPSIAEYVITTTKNDSDIISSNTYNFTDNGTHNGSNVTLTVTYATIDANDTKNLTLGNYLKWLLGWK
ncbi:hypothetical protein [Methanobacterium petrolearium]|uniref:hypothetical protein n=1 Tax=Methanobacterium petrolearium TaxID=710190 RepID=UPI001AE44460|nr:hypothetical protein [Methanobacterium petrolearium]MBP1944914.1 putative PurR-regulated permease PerM [Methanobacterium petrolearium]BDZ70224.1 hypothetical protein GCM10025861_07410 [Methanobacterium petrolearium]